MVGDESKELCEAVSRVGRRCLPCSEFAALFGYELVFSESRLKAFGFCEEQIELLLALAAFGVEPDDGGDEQEAGEDGGTNEGGFAGIEGGRGGVGAEEIEAGFSGFCEPCHGECAGCAVVGGTEGDLEAGGLELFCEEAGL
ncbi:MAG: hypothetical protein RLZZ458_623 [Planctomycetota bacterium]